MAGGDCAPHRTSGDIFDCHSWEEEGCYWHLGDKSQGDSQTPKDAWESPCNKAFAESLRKSSLDRFSNLKGSSREVIPRGFPLTVISSKTLWTQ